MPPKQPPQFVRTKLRLVKGQGQRSSDQFQVGPRNHDKQSKLRPPPRHPISLPRRSSTWISGRWPGGSPDMDIGGSASSASEGTGSPEINRPTFGTSPARFRPGPHVFPQTKTGIPNLNMVVSRSTGFLTDGEKSPTPDAKPRTASPRQGASSWQHRTPSPLHRGISRERRRGRELEHRSQKRCRDLPLDARGDPEHSPRSIS